MLKGVSMIPAAQHEDAEGDRLNAEADAQSPIKLFLKDATVLFTNLGYVIYAFAPMSLAEALPGVRYSKLRLLLEYGYLALLSLFEVVIVLSVPPLWVVLPGPIFFIVAGALLLLSIVMSALLWGSIVVKSNNELDTKYATKFGRERWIFINGIATSHYMLQLSCDLLSATFKRPVIGIHNRTYGVIGDVIECLMQRSLRYMGRDSRRVYASLREALIDDTNIDKVVVITHSQGGIILSLVLDRLYATVPSSHFSKLEVYTFGSAASYFHNPPLIIRKPPGLGITKSHSLPVDDPNASTLSSTSETTTSKSKKKRRRNLASEGQELSVDAKLASPPAQLDGLPVELSPTQNKDLALPNNYIHTVEHYCNSYDIVPRWGVLFGKSQKTNTPLTYSGRVFVHEKATGHLYDQHYLTMMFPLASLDEIQRDDDDGDLKLFLNHPVQMVGALERQAILRAQTFPLIDRGRKQSLVGKSSLEYKGRRVKDLSRLWRYMGGGVS